MTLEEAKSLKFGDYIICTVEFYSDGKTLRRYKVNGEPKIWKLDPHSIYVPIKFGINHFDYMTERDLHLFELGLNHFRYVCKKALDIASGK